MFDGALEHTLLDPFMKELNSFDKNYFYCHISGTQIHQLYGMILAKFSQGNPGESM